MGLIVQKCSFCGRKCGVSMEQTAVTRVFMDHTKEDAGMGMDAPYWTRYLLRKTINSDQYFHRPKMDTCHARGSGAKGTS